MSFEALPQKRKKLANDGDPNSELIPSSLDDLKLWSSEPKVPNSGVVLDNFPNEIILEIIKLLPLPTQACIPLVNIASYHFFSKHVWEALNSSRNQAEKEVFLDHLAKDQPERLYYCSDCHKLHPRNNDVPFLYHPLLSRKLVCYTNDSFLHVGQGLHATHAHVTGVLQQALQGPTVGLPTSIFKLDFPSQTQSDLWPNYAFPWQAVTSEVRVVRGSLLLRIETIVTTERTCEVHVCMHTTLSWPMSQLRPSAPLATDPSPLQFGSIVRKRGSLLVDASMAEEAKRVTKRQARTAMRHTSHNCPALAFKAGCAQLHKCATCETEFQVQVEQRRVTVTAWYDLGDGTAGDERWALRDPKYLSCVFGIPFTWFRQGGCSFALRPTFRPGKLRRAWEEHVAHEVPKRIVDKNAVGADKIVGFHDAAKGYGSDKARSQPQASKEADGNRYNLRPRRNRTTAVLG